MIGTRYTQPGRSRSAAGVSAKVERTMAILFSIPAVQTYNWILLDPISAAARAVKQ
jgi:hypothetical protein